MDSFQEGMPEGMGVQKKQEYAGDEQRAKIADLARMEEALNEKARVASTQTKNRSSTKNLSMGQVISETHISTHFTMQMIKLFFLFCTPHTERHSLDREDPGRHVHRLRR
jgi:hypothetical protein